MAAEALSHLSRAWSRWGSRLVEVIAKQANVPDHELSQTRVSDESFWRQFRDAAGVVVESFIKKYVPIAVAKLLLNFQFISLALFASDRNLLQGSSSVRAKGRCEGSCRRRHLQRRSISCSKRISAARLLKLPFSTIIA